MLRKKEGEGWDPVFAGAVFGHSVVHYPCLPALLNTFTPIKDPFYHPTSYLPHSFFGWSDIRNVGDCCIFSCEEAALEDQMFSVCVCLSTEFHL